MANKSKFLPLFTNLRTLYWLSFLIAFLMLTASISGIFFTGNIYPSEELINSFLTNDYINLIIGLPVLFICLWAISRGVISGMLCWPGAILFVIYNYIAYAIALPFEPLFLLYLALIILSVSSLVFYVQNFDRTAITKKMKKTIPNKLSGWILIIFGSIFFMRVIAIVLIALIEGTILQITDLAVNGADFIISPIWIISGISLIRKKDFGYISGMAMLLQGSMLFIGLLLLLIIRPIITMTSFNLLDFVVIALMGLIFFIPTFLYFRKVKLK